MTINVTGQVFFGTHGTDHLGPGFGDDSYHMTADDFITDTIDGGKGEDSVNYSASSVGVSITLTDPTTIGGATGGSVEADFPITLINPSTHQPIVVEHQQIVATLTNIEDIVGSNKNDILTGDSGANVITGGGGVDQLTGGGGTDRFVFSHASDSPAVPYGPQILTNIDQITDFEVGVDKIDLRGLINETTGHAPLHFGSLIAGEPSVVSFFASNGTPQGTGFLVMADLNGDQNPDFEVFVHVTQPHTPLHASDFLLS
jgi:Ca2+-binding RTX toxin-like protein